MPISGCRTSVRLVLSFQAMASSLTGAASFYAATAQQAIEAAVPPSPRPWLRVVSWNTGPGRAKSIVSKLRDARVSEEFDVILLQELPGQWANPMTPGAVEKLLHQVFPSYLRRFGEFCASRVCVLCVCFFLRVLRFGCVRFGRFALWRVLPGFRLARCAFCVLDLLHFVRFGALRLRSGICVLLNLLRFPADHWWILVLRSLVTVVRKALTSAGMAGMPTQVERRLFPSNSGKSKWWRFAQEVSCVGAENLRCGAFAFCVPFVCCLRAG